MIIYVAWPVARVKKSNETFEAWKARGFKVAVVTDIFAPGDRGIAGLKCDVPPLLMDQYDGYFRSMATLSHGLCKEYRADIVVFAGEGIYPDPSRSAHEVATTFAAKFPNGFGVMQPVGGIWKPSISGPEAQPGMGGGKRKMYVTPPSHMRCESPWMGRWFILNSYDGKGPYFGDYNQYFGDVELHDVAARMGVLWKREDLIQPREHWSRPGGPPMQQWQSNAFDRWYEKDWAMYRSRRQKGFPTSGAAGSATLIVPDKKIIVPE